ncbi:MAG: acetylglutamate kinase [Rikenellaceae bacterium]|jgi:acetylglutamate kinase|nr:acetylglutamate kinase [Rikenellaceae bacterium]
MIKVIKIGGNVVDNPEKLSRFLSDFAALEGDKILVHGGGKIATAISKSLGIETQMIDGRRVTDAPTLQVVTMVYAGWINKSIVNRLQTLGCNALGLSGADGRLIVSQKRAASPVDYGFVGDPIPEKFGIRTAQTLIEGGFTLVVAPITASEAGDLLNTNADTVAQTIALGMSAIDEVELVYCFEKAGVLLDVNDETSVLPEITPAYFAELKAQGIVSEGMIPKLENAFKAIAGGVRSVVICNAEMLSQPGYGGTTLRNK